MKEPSRRPEQVADTIRQVITEALAREVRDPRVGFVTVTGVLVTNDLSHARVMVSVPGDEAEKTRALAGTPERRRLPPQPRRARAHHPIVPELHFELDKGVEHAARIEELLDVDSPGGAGLIGAVLVDKPAGPDVARRGAAGAPGAPDQAGGAHRNAGSVRDRTAGRAGGTGHPARAVRGVARPRPTSPPPGSASGPTPTTSPAR